MDIKKVVPAVIIILLCLFGVEACRMKPNFRYSYSDVNKLIHETENLKEKPFLKAHLKTGEVFIFTKWSVDTIANTVKGTGTKYDLNRTVTDGGELSVPIDQVSIFETNTMLKSSENDRLGALAILTGLNLVATTICITNPKACFGSCPTFYINENDNFHYADAEGFSNAIAPSMMYGDIDALTTHGDLNGEFSLTMKNEALETHCIKDVKLLAYPRKVNEQVYQTNADEFYLCEEVHEVTKAKGPEGDIRMLINRSDKQERFSYADQKNLNSREDIYLEFPEVEGNRQLGLVVDFRQTLMTTYFIYSAIGYMGDEASDIFAKLENEKNAAEKLENGIKKELGNIDFYTWNEKNKKWVLEAGLYETGPIAINKQLVPLSGQQNKKGVKVKIVLNKGLWRMDCIALTTMKEKVEPILISPYLIQNKKVKDNKALQKLMSSDQYLISMPGSEYQFHFKLPDSRKDYQLFLYSNGYYLEWMIREHWIKDKDLLKLYQMVNMPKTYLKQEAKNYSPYERTMENEFWNSKIDTKTFSYYEN